MKLTKYNLEYTYSKKTRILIVQTNFRRVPLRFKEVTESTYWDHIDPDKILFIIRTFTKEEVLKFQKEWTALDFIEKLGDIKLIRVFNSRKST